MNPIHRVTVWSALVVLALGGCGEKSVGVSADQPARTSVGAPATTPTGPPTREDHDLPDDFPLAAGWPPDDAAEPDPSHGLRGPGRGLPPPRFEACGERAPDPGHTDRLVARWTNVEDYRARQVTTYADSDEAAAAVDAFVDFYRGCPTDEGVAGDDYVTTILVSRTDAGEASWAVARAAEYLGHPAVGLEVLHVVRVGRAVLIDTAANEGGAGEDRSAGIADQIARQTELVREVVEAMCTYADGGCVP